ncbi:MAG: alpha-amylase/4-alpha-glucanotransferase domain-containing protein [bacterium]
MKTVNFIFGVHNHQPVGNFDAVFEEGYTKAYLPFLDELEKHPAVRMMYHTTGPLLDWLDDHHPDFLDRVRELAQRGQIEIMTGGHYEPILAVLPDRDKAGQIRMMTDYIKNRFGVDAKGAWIAERIWEPHLAKALNEAGVEFIALDDYHFHSAGMNPDELLGYYRTDEQGYGLSLFPISMQLRYLMPFSQPEETLAHLRKKASEDGENLLVMCDDGEKFGMWPGTHDWVYRKGWLKRFFKGLEEAMDEGWLNMPTASEFAEKHYPRHRVYLPCASYFEMSEWSLAPESGAKFNAIVHELEAAEKMDELRPYIKGGFWRNFIGKYEESNRMYRKALWVSNQVAALESNSDVSEAARDYIGKAKVSLYKGQCNCAYWHGVFGGLYLPHLRHAVYQSLLEAEDYCNIAAGEGDNFLEIAGSDFSADGTQELLLRNRRMGVTIAPRKGGGIYELDFLPSRFNLLNTLKRQPESYHQKVGAASDDLKEGASIHDQVLSKEKDLERFLIYDKHLRGALLDHFFSGEESPDSLYEGSYFELGDFIDQPYSTEVRPGGNENSITLTRQGKVVDNNVEVSKTLRLLTERDGLEIEYRISNNSDIPLTILFAPEFNFALLGGNTSDRFYRDERKLNRQPLNSKGISTNVKIFSLIDEADGFAVHFQFEGETEVWRYPVETVSQSEGGYERVYQSSCVLPVFRLNVNQDQPVDIRFKLMIQPL